MRSRSAGQTAALLCRTIAPTGNGPFPAVLVMHGCGGIIDNHRSWAGRLVGWGYAAVIVDSFRPRNNAGSARTSTSFPIAVRGLDAHNAAIYLRTLPNIQADRIGIVGFSTVAGRPFGPRSTNAFRVGRGGRPFQAAVAYYPPCSGGKIVEPFATDVLILVGKDDTWTPADLCLKTVAARANQARPPAIKVYPGAVHDFDTGGLPTLSSSGHMIGGNPEAAADSFAMTKAFLDARLKVK